MDSALLLENGWGAYGELLWCVQFPILMGCLAIGGVSASGEIRYSMIQYSNAPGIHYGTDQGIFPGYTWVLAATIMQFITSYQFIVYLTSSDAILLAGGVILNILYN